MTLKEAIFDQTNGGYDVFEYYIPEQNLSKPFFLREEKTPSSHLKAINGVYYVRDFGDPEYDVYSKNCIDFVMHQQNISGYYEAKKKIVEDLKLKIDLNAFSGIERHYGYEISKDLKELSEKQRKYLNGRGITDEAIEFRDIKACTHYFPQVNKELEAIAFPYYDDKRYLVNIKYRSFHKNPKTGKVERLFTMHKGGKLELYGIHKLTSDITECFFVEGETDAATMDSYFFEMGIQPMLTISIPNGVNSLMSIPDVKKRLEHIKTFYVFSDEGKAGKGLETKIVDMFGKHRCKIVPKSGGDDVNEIYQKNGYKGIGECIDNAYYLPVEGIITANNVMNKLYDMHLNGISRGATLGYPNFDKLVSFITPQLTLVTGIPGHGKAEDINTLIPTPNGFVKMGDLKVGDKVFDENGNPCNVVAKSQVWEDRPTYELTFSDNSTSICDENHEWLTDNWKSRRSTSNAKKNNRLDGRGLKKKGVDQSSKRTYPTVKSTKEIIESIRVKSDNRLNHSVNLCKPINIPEKELEIHPYVLGCWLGDGDSSSGCYTTNDIEVIERIKSLGYQVSKHKKESRYNILGLVSQLRNINVLNNKHIPKNYLFSSIEQRYEILRGLMDSDGYCGKDARNEFCTVRANLAKQVYQLICSLGIKATLTESDAKIYGRVISKRYRIFFTTDKTVYHLKRHQDIINDKFKHNIPKSSNVRYVKSFKRVYGHKTQCIQVDSKSRLYLSGEQFIPTHNSTCLKQITVRLARNDGWKMGFFSPEDPDAERFYRKVMMQVTGKAFKINSRNIPPEYQITDNEFWQAQKFASEHFFFLNPTSYDLESILELCASAIVKYNLKSIVIDPFNYISIENRDTGTINAILTRLNQFKKEHNVHIFLVAHPTKMKKKTKYEDGKKVDSFEFEVPTPYDVAHTSDFYNQVDNSFTFYRNADDSVEWHVHKFRDDDIGSTGKAVFRFNHWSKTYDELF